MGQIFKMFPITFQHISPKRLGLLALVHYKSGKNVLADSQSTVEQLAVGYFSQFKGLNAILDAIRNKLDLDNAPDWHRLAKKLFKKKAEATKKEKKKNESDSDKLEKSNGKREKSAVSKKEKKQTESTQQNAAALQSDESSESSASEEDDDDNDVGTESLPAPTTVDDFFVTADGSNYLSTAVASEKPDDDSDDDLKAHKKHGNSFAMKLNESTARQKNSKKPVKLGTNRSEGGEKRKWTDGKDEQPNAGKQLKVDSNLHPSWLAKQKLKPTITEFKGKKITFD